jgi:hypothetical protein
MANRPLEILPELQLTTFTLVAVSFRVNSTTVFLSLLAAYVTVISGVSDLKKALPGFEPGLTENPANQNPL